MSRGAPFTTDWLGTSPLHLTALYNREETCDVLLKAGCSRDARTKVDKTPLHVAAQEGNTSICRLLLEQGADVDAKDMLRMTPLHWAVERGCNSTVEFLLRHGANTNIESKFDKTPLEIASENGRPDIFEMLQKAAEYRVVAIEGEGGMGVSQQEVVHSLLLIMCPAISSMGDHLILFMPRWFKRKRQFSRRRRKQTSSISSQNWRLSLMEAASKRSLWIRFR